MTADCRPVPFTCKGSESREPPPIGSNLQGAFEAPSADADAEVLVPGLVFDCVAAVERRGMGVKGLYKNQESTAAKIKTLLESYFVFPVATEGGVATSCRPNFQVVVDIHLVCGVLKRFLRELDEPLISYEQYVPIIEAAHQPYDPVNTNPRLCDVREALESVNFKFSLRTVSGLVKNPCYKILYSEIRGRALSKGAAV